MSVGRHLGLFFVVVLFYLEEKIIVQLTFLFDSCGGCVCVCVCVSVYVCACVCVCVCSSALTQNST